jgi:lipopolysaccharide export system protein LptC
MSPPRDRRGWRRAGRHSRFVDVMRYLLPATAALLVGLVVAWPYVMGDGEGLIVPLYDNERIEAADPMRMQAPRYVGRGGDDRPYEVRARSAVLDPGAPDRIELDELQADVVARLRELHVEALIGVYHRDERKLDLSGGIDMISSDGYRLRTDSALVDLATGGLVSETPVWADGPAGSMSAERFEIEEGGDVMRFHDNVRVQFRTVPRAEGGS